MFFSWTVVFHLCEQLSTKGERIQFSRYPPLAWITLCGFPRGMMSEISQSITHMHCSCFGEWITEFSAQFQFWKGKHRLVLANWGAGAKSLQQRWKCLISTSDGCGDICVFAHVFMAFLGFLWFRMGNIKEARWNGIDFLISKHMQKSKIRLLEQIWAQNPYVTFFLGHPVFLSCISH